MKVELLVNLKLGNGHVVSAGSVYSDKNTPIPEFVMRRLKRGMARIIENDPPPPPLVSKPDTVSEVVVPLASKKVLKKKTKKEGEDDG